MANVCGVLVVSAPPVKRRFSCHEANLVRVGIRVKVADHDTRQFPRGLAYKTIDGGHLKLPPITFIRAVGEMRAKEMEEALRELDVRVHHDTRHGALRGRQRLGFPAENRITAENGVADRPSAEGCCGDVKRVQTLDGGKLSRLVHSARRVVYDFLETDHVRLKPSKLGEDELPALVVGLREMPDVECADAEVPEPGSRGDIHGLESEKKRAGDPALFSLGILGHQAFRNSVCSFMARPMSPAILSLPCMKAIWPFSLPKVRST